MELEPEVGGRGEEYCSKGHCVVGYLLYIVIYIIIVLSRWHLILCGSVMSITFVVSGLITTFLWTIK